MTFRIPFHKLALSAALSRGVASRLLPLAALATLSLAASAQLAGKGAINGRVTDSGGAAIPGATLTITRNDTNVSTTAKSTGAGEYSFSLDPGKYTLTVSHEGFSTTKQENIQVDALQSFGLDIALQTGAVNQEITVTDAPPLLETSNASLGVTIEQEQYSALPLIEDGGGQRRATDFAALLPGVNSNVTNGNLTTNAGSVNGGGSRGAVSSIYIDGVPITSVGGEGDPRFVWTSMAVDAIDQFQVETVGYSAIYEGQGVQNYNVKSGTNKLHGSVYDYYRDTGLDTWGFQKANNPVTGLPQKPSEHQNEYAAFLGFPILKDKLFIFGGYEGYRFRRQVPYAFETIPTLLMRQGNFSELASNCPTTANSTTVVAGCLYDPDTTVTTNNGTSYTRTAFPNNQLTRISSAAQKLESYLPAPTNSAISNNYLINYKTGLSNWTTTNRIDYAISKRQSISAVIAFGRQSTTAPAAVSISATSNGLPIPYISSQQFFPKTKVILFEHDFTFTSNLVNQFKYGYGRYDSTGLNQDQGGPYGAAANGISGLPAGQATNSFPTVTFSGNTNINRWAGYSSNRNAASGFVLIDNVQWNHGRHSFTFGGEIAWMQYNFLNNATGVNPLQLSFSNAATGGYAAGANSVTSTTGNGYASFLLGAPSSGSFTLSAVPETGARFRPISPYVQDNWKVTSKLTLDLGLRWDYYPTYREVQNRFSFLDLNATNPLTGTKGALAFGGFGSGLCNCNQPVNDNMKNFGPRIGFAYQATPTTVVRGSYGIIYTHGNANGGSATSRQGSGLQGFSVTPTTSFVSPTNGQVGNQYWKIDTPYPAYTAPPTLNPALGTYNTTASTQSAQTPVYADPYLGGKSPQFTNFSFGIQQALSNTATLTISYVGSEGRFLQPDSTNGRGYYANALDPKYLNLTTTLAKSATATNLAAAGIAAPYPTFGGVGNPNIAQALKPLPQYNSVSDTYGFVGRTWYNAMQAYITQRVSHGLTFMTNYTWSKAIDNNGTFRTGYDIPSYAAADGQFHAARSLDRSTSLGDQRHKFVLTGAWNMPFGTGKLGGGNAVTRALFGGFRFSGILTAGTGGPVSVTMNTANTNPASNAAYPLRNPSYYGNGRVAGTDHPHTALEVGQKAFLDSNAFLRTPDYIFSTTPRTAAYSGLVQPGTYRLDLSMRRSFKIPTGGLHEGTKLALEADYFNVTNHTHFVYSVANAVLNTWGTASYGTMGVDTNAPINRAMQLAARIEF